MKRIFTFVLTIGAVLCLAACAVTKGGSSSRRNGLGSAFSAAVSITIDRLEAQGEIKRYGEGVWEIEFSEPNTLSGVKLEFSEGNVLASYKGLSFSVPQSAVPVKAMMLNLIKAVEDNAKLDELSGEESDGILKISGSLDGGDYTLSVDGNGLLSGFEMPNNKLSMKFSEMKTAEITIEQATAAETSVAVTAETTTTEQ
ncbi:hypothetical protein [Ruminococcus flavefaciens]|uniref:hypothetical protein n=1 Tax=Ruminococcus flavefaciens TaxID=1265 RepID=UPI0026E940FC|nr:hypothetical protein [Ruminococcus flavefaciens]